MSEPTTNRAQIRLDDAPPPLARQAGLAIDPGRQPEGGLPPPLPKVGAAQASARAAVEYLFGDLPIYDAELLDAIEKNRESMLALLVPRNRVIDLVRAELSEGRRRESRAALWQRVDKQRKMLEEDQDAGTASTPAASRLAGSHGWRLLRDCLGSDDGFRSFKAVFCEPELQRRLATLRDAFANYAEDKLLTLGEQGDLEKLSKELCLTDEEFLAEVERIRLSGVQVDEAPPLLRDAPKLRSPAEIAQFARKNPLEAEKLLGRALENERIVPWLEQLFLHGKPSHAVARAVEQAYFDGGKSEFTKLTGAWRVLWSFGYPGLVLGITAGSPVVSTLEELRDAIHRVGPRAALESVLSRGLLVEWLVANDAHLHPPPGLLSVVRDVASRKRTEVDFWKVGWATGLGDLQWDGKPLESIDDVLALDADGKMPKDVDMDLFLAWIRHGLRLEAEADRVQKWRAPGKDSLPRLIRRVQWAVGRLDLVFGVFRLEDMEPAALVQAAGMSSRTLEALGGAVADGCFTDWLIARVAARRLLARSKPATEGVALESLEAVRKAGLPPFLTAYATLWLTGTPKLRLFGAAEPTFDLGQDSVLEDLVRSAPDHWQLFSRAENRTALDLWLRLDHGGAKAATVNANVPSDLFALLARFEDTTIRHVTGKPFEIEGRTFGGLQHHAGDVRKDLAATLLVRKDIPRSLDVLFCTGALHQWASLHSPDLQKELEAKLSSLGGRTSRLEAVARVLGFRRLVLSDRVTVETEGQLVKVGCDHLASVERLLDSRVLETWVQSAHHEAIRAIREHSEAARKLLERRSATKANVLDMYAVGAMACLANRAAACLATLAGKKLDALVPDVQERFVHPKVPALSKAILYLPSLNVVSNQASATILVTRLTEDGHIKPVMLVSTADQLAGTQIAVPVDLPKTKRVNRVTERLVFTTSSGSAEQHVERQVVVPVGLPWTQSWSDVRQLFSRGLPISLSLILHGVGLWTFLRLGQLAGGLTWEEFRFYSVPSLWGFLGLVLLVMAWTVAWAGVVKSSGSDCPWPDRTLLGFDEPASAFGVSIALGVTLSVAGLVLLFVTAPVMWMLYQITDVNIGTQGAALLPIRWLELAPMAGPVVAHTVTVALGVHVASVLKTRGYAILGTLFVIMALAAAVAPFV